MAVIWSDKYVTNANTVPFHTNPSNGNMFEKHWCTIWRTNGWTCGIDLKNNTKNKNYTLKWWLFDLFKRIGNKRIDQSLITQFQVYFLNIGLWWIICNMHWFNPYWRKQKRYLISLLWYFWVYISYVDCWSFVVCASNKRETKRELLLWEKSVFIVSMNSR